MPMAQLDLGTAGSAPAVIGPGIESAFICCAQVYQRPHPWNSLLVSGKEVRQGTEMALARRVAMQQSCPNVLDRIRCLRYTFTITRSRESHGDSSGQMRQQSGPGQGMLLACTPDTLVGVYHAMTNDPGWTDRWRSKSIARWGLAGTVRGAKHVLSGIKSEHLERQALGSDSLASVCINVNQGAPVRRRCGEAE